MQNSQRARSVLKKVNDRPQSDRSKSSTSQRFELQFSCENLVNQLAVGQPKPQLLVFLNGKLHDETEVGNGLSPSFSKKIECDYEFGKPQDLTVIVRNTIWHIIPRGEKKMTFGRAKISLDVILQQGSKGAKLKLRAAPSDKEKSQGLKYADGGRIYSGVLKIGNNKGFFCDDHKF